MTQPRNLEQAPWDCVLHIFRRELHQQALRRREAGGNGELRRRITLRAMEVCDMQLGRACYRG